MPRSLGNVIADSLQLSIGYADRLLKGVPAERFARFAVVGGQIVESNHPAFVYGHRWAPGMLVVWDNRRLVHAATGGYEGHRRLLHRVTIAERPPEGIGRDTH